MGTAGWPALVTSKLALTYICLHISWRVRWDGQKHSFSMIHKTLLFLAVMTLTLSIQEPTSTLVALELHNPTCGIFLFHSTPQPRLTPSDPLTYSAAYGARAPGRRSRHVHVRSPHSRRAALPRPLPGHSYTEANNHGCQPWNPTLVHAYRDTGTCMGKPHTARKIDARTTVTFTTWKRSWLPGPWGGRGGGSRQLLPRTSSQSQAR